MTFTRRRGQRGATTVENALILLTFVIICVGVVDIAQFLFLQQSLAERVRNVGRIAVVKNYTEDEVRNLILYNRRTVPDGIVVGAYGLTPSNVYVSISDNGSTSQRLEVQVRNLPLKTVSPFLSRTLNNIPIQITTPLETP